MISLIHNPIFGFVRFEIQNPTYYEEVQFLCLNHWGIKLRNESTVALMINVVA
jgi:hypothetical protein